MRAWWLVLILVPLAGCLSDAPEAQGPAATADTPVSGTGTWRIVVDCTETPLGYSCNSNNGATSNCLTVRGTDRGAVERLTVTAEWDPAGSGTDRMEVHASMVGTGERAMAVGAPGVGLVLDADFLDAGDELRVFVTPEDRSLTVADHLPVDMDLLWLEGDLSPSVHGGVCA